VALPPTNTSRANLRMREPVTNIWLSFSPAKPLCPMTYATLSSGSTIQTVRTTLRLGS